MNPPAPITDHDYEAIAEAVMETERGRWFLAEFARRNRAADTAMVLSALEEVERRLAARAPADNETFAELLRHVASRAALLREALESEPDETRAARALRHLDRLESLVALASPKDETPLSFGSSLIAESEPVAETAAPALVVFEPERTPEPVAKPSVEPKAVPRPEPTHALADLRDKLPASVEAPAIVEPTPPSVSAAPPLAEAAPAPKPAERPVVAKEEARRAPKVDPVEPPRPARSGPDLLGSLSAAERAMLFA
ncbi:MAG: hypothetical protein ABW275_11890 [Hansschlegelia sp.]